VRDGGVFDGATRKALWSPASKESLRALDPGAEDDVKFTINTRERPLVKGSQDKHITLRMKAGINAENLPQELAGTDVRSEDAIQFKVSSPILFAAKSVWRASPIVNSGPLPPKVGEKTTYAIVWEIRNFTNDLQNVEIKTALPPNVKWEERIFPAETRMVFDAPSGEVKWRIGEVKAGTGVVSPAFIGAFQVSITPSEIDRKKAVVLSKETRLTGLDSFTGQSIERNVESLSTELAADTPTNRDEWAVQ